MIMSVLAIRLAVHFLQVLMLEPATKWSQHRKRSVSLERALRLLKPMTKMFRESEQDGFSITDSTCAVVGTTQTAQGIASQAFRGYGFGKFHPLDVVKIAAAYAGYKSN